MYTSLMTDLSNANVPELLSILLFDSGRSGDHLMAILSPDGDWRSSAKSEGSLTAFREIHEISSSCIYACMRSTLGNLWYRVDVSTEFTILSRFFGWSGF